MIKETFNADWYYRREDGSDRGELTGPLTLPHDAMRFEARDAQARSGYNSGYYPGGDYRYVKHFMVPQDWPGQHVVFEFEGVYKNSEVRINGRLAGGRPSGYAQFRISADGLLNVGELNQIEVLARNADEPNSRWYSGSGIYRSVHLLRSGLPCFEPAGIRIRTLDANEKEACLLALIRLRKDGAMDRQVRVGLVFTGPGGEHAEAILDGVDGTELCLDFRIAAPALWSPDEPNLYHWEARIYDGETCSDFDSGMFGIRVLALDAQQGLRINGQPLKLRGGCVHHDNGVIGATTLAAAEERRVRRMKEAGFNAIRSAHNPMSVAMLDACDRLGMLVMDEFSDVWLREKTPFDYSLYFAEWWERDIEAMVEKDYNHPSVIMYSIGNEIAETAKPAGAAWSQRLANKVRTLDPGRYVINSVNGWYSLLSVFDRGEVKPRAASPTEPARKSGYRKSTSAYINPLMSLINRFMDAIVTLPLVDRGTRAVFATVDVAGYNYMAGRYALDGHRYPQRVICGSESFPPEIARNWRLVKRLPNVIGDFSWAGWDYLGEAGLCTWQYGRNQAQYKPYPCVLADSALIDITGFRQSQSYLHAIVWGLRSEPFIAVRPVQHSGEPISKSIWRGTDALSSWSWEGCEGRPAVVEVYADAAYVELFQDGRSLGRRAAGDRRDFKAVFHTTYQPGELEAVAYAAGGQVTGRCGLRSAGAQLCLHVDVENDVLMAGGCDLAFLNITLGDESGIVRPLADRPVKVQVDGEGELLGFGSANPLNPQPFTGDTHTTYQGRALAVVRSGLIEGRIRVRVTAQDCIPVQLDLVVAEE